MKKTLHRLSIIIFLFSSQFVYSQQHLFLGFQYDWGPFGRKIASKRDVLKTEGLGSFTAPRLSLQYRVFDRIAVEVGAGIPRYKWVMNDKAFESRHEGFEVDLQNLNRYHSYFTSLTYSHKLEPRQYLYFKAAFEYGAVGGGETSQSREFQLGNEEVNFSSSYINEQYSIIPEVGLQFMTKNQHMWSIGLKYNITQGGDMMTGTYQVLDNNDVVSEDNISTSGSYLALNISYNMLLMHKTKREKRHKNKDPKPVEEPLITEEEEAPVDEDEHQVNDREYVVQHKVRVKSENVTIKVWDHQMIDGDIVSLILNDVWLIQNYTLKKEKYEIQVKLNEGDNNFILYAKNLGEYKPNTAAIIIDDGIKEHMVVLESNLDESGAIEIKYKP